MSFRHPQAFPPIISVPAPSFCGLLSPGPEEEPQQAHFLRYAHRIPKFLFVPLPLTDPQCFQASMQTLLPPYSQLRVREYYTTYHAINPKNSPYLSAFADLRSAEDAIFHFTHDGKEAGIGAGWAVFTFDGKMVKDGNEQTWYAMDVAGEEVKGDEYLIWKFVPEKAWIDDDYIEYDEIKAARGAERKKECEKERGILETMRKRVLELLDEISEDETDGMEADMPVGGDQKTGNHVEKDNLLIWDDSSSKLRRSENERRHGDGDAGAYYRVFI